MASLTVSSKPKKRVRFSNDNPELLLKPKPCKVAIYYIGKPELIAIVKTAKQIEKEEHDELRSLKRSSNAWRPKKRIQRRRSFVEDFLSEDDDDNIDDAVWELLQNAIILDGDEL